MDKTYDKNLDELKNSIFKLCDVVIKEFSGSAPSDSAKSDKIADKKAFRRKILDKKNEIDNWRRGVNECFQMKKQKNL